MTQTQTDPWAATAQGNGQPATQPQQDSLMPAKPDFDPLFGSGPMPSLFNKTHAVGQKLAGVIKDEPYDVQKRQYGTGKPMFWAPDGEMTEKPTTAGQPNRPVMDTVVPLDTQYRLTAQELADKGMQDDDGTRGWYCGGNDLKALRAAIRKSGARSRADLVGLRLTVWRSGQVPSGKGNPSWTYEAELTR